MAENKEVLKIDLDNRDFLQGVKEAQGALGALGSGDSLDGLIGTMKQLGPIIAGVAATVYGLKKAIDFSLEAENINQVNAQFDAMAKSLGIAADVMRDRLAVATRGLVDDTDVLKAANQAFVVLGDNASKLPEIFELARKSVSVFGGDILGRVEQISTALATGNMRSLRSIGITVDSEKAMRGYAASIHQTVDTLTEAQRKQALMDAALESMRTKFKNVNEDIRPLTVSIQQLKVIIADIGETIMLMVNKVAGPSLVKFTEYLKDVAKSASLYLKEKFGDESAAVERKVRQLTASVKEFDENISALEKREGILNKLLPDSVIEGKIEKLKTMRAAVAEQLAAMQKDMEKTSESPLKTGAGPALPAGLSVTPEQAAQAEAERMALVLKMREIEYQSAQDTTAMYVNAEQERAALVETIRAESEARIAAIHAAGPGKVKNAAEQELLIRKEAAAKIDKINKDSEASKKKTFAETYASLNKGQQALTSGMVAGFKSIGGGAKEMARAMKAAMLGVIADEAEASGAKYIAEGIASWPFGAPKIAGGSALVALSGLIRAAAGGGGGGIGAGGAGGGGGASAPAGTPATTATGEYNARPELVAPPTRGRQVTIAVQGNYFETEQTRRALMEMIRQETDATAFSYTQISQGAV